jgi:hypothetical protein
MVEILLCFILQGLNITYQEKVSASCLLPISGKILFMSMFDFGRNFGMFNICDVEL